MNKILLITSDTTLRQLYHELFSAEKCDVSVVENITEALLFLTLHTFAIIILYVQHETETKTFMHLRKRRRKWQHIPLIILTPKPQVFQSVLTKKDLLFNSTLIRPEDIVDTIKLLRL